MCGIFGVFNCPKAAEVTYLGLHAIQHRAQEYAGIITSDGTNTYQGRGKGIVQDVFTQEDLNQLHGRYALGHTRYSTTEDNPTLINIQPLTGVFAEGEVSLVHNGNLINYDSLREKLKNTGPFKTSIDTELILRLFCQSNQTDVVRRVFEAVIQIQGSYSLAFLYKDTMIIVRDPWGIRPLSLGQRDGSWFVSSETVAFNNLGIEFIREIAPGEILLIDKNGLRSYYFDEKSLSDKPIAHPKAYCIFELLYFAHPGSFLFNRWVVDFRICAGKKLRQTCPSTGKNVVPVPDSANFHAEGYANGDKEAKLVAGILRSHYIGRTFIEPQQDLRTLKVGRKFTAIQPLLEGKSITLVDDSIVRLTTLPDVIKLIRGAGAKEVHLRIATPPITHPCFYGIDTPTRQELAAANLTLEEIKERSGANSLEFMPMAALRQLVSNPQDYCFACMTGNYPIPTQP